MKQRNPTTTQTTTTNKPTENTFKPLIIPAREKPEETKGTLFVKDEEFKPSEEKSEYTRRDSEPDGPVWNLDPMIKNLSKKFFDKSTRIEYDAKTQTRNDVRQYHENMFANYTLRSLKVANLIKKMVNTEVQYIFDVKFALLDYLDSELMKGGHQNMAANNKIVNELNIKEADSIHDFKASDDRNNVFPVEITKAKTKASKSSTGEKENSKNSIILDKISKILSNVVNPKMNMSDILGDYFRKSPGQFEEDIKVKYLIGELAFGLDDVSYYFTGGKDNISSTKWNELRKSFFETIPVNEIDKLFEDIKAHNIEYWIFDACMASYVTKGMLPEKFRTLANMWDPATSANPTLEELGEKILSDKEPRNSSFIEVVERPTDNSIPNGKKIYDWQNSNGESYYDLIYDELINRDIMTTFYGIKIKIRTAVDEIEKKNKVKKCSVAVCIYVDEKFKYVICIDGGFGVNELAMGMHYIETGDITYTKDTKTYNLRSELQELIDVLNRYFINTGKKRKESSNEFFKNEYYKLLLRFKSSGDHGQAITVKILNTIFNKATVFISGDALACVYSIAQEIPTICRYYKLKGDKEHDDEHEEEEEDHKGPLFIAGYFPMKDNKEKYEKLFNRRISTIGDLYISEYINPNLNKTPLITEITLEEFKTLKSTLVELITQGEAFIDTLQPFKKDIHIDSKTKKSKSAQETGKEDEINILINEKIQEIYSTNIDGKQLITLLESVPNNIDRLFLKDEYDYASMKEYNNLIDHFIKTWYLIKNYVKIVKLVKGNINDMIKSLDFIVSINEEQTLNDMELEQRRENSRGIQLHTNLAALNTRYKEIKETIGVIDKDILLDMAESVAGKTEAQTLRSKLTQIRSTLLNNKTQLSSILNAELAIQPQFYAELSNVIEVLKEEYLIKIKNKIEDIPTFGKAINDYFSKCFETNIKMDKPTIIAEIEELKADAEEKKPEAEQQVETIFINIKAAEANEILKELDTQETLPVIPLEKAKKLGKKKEIVEESVNDMAIAEVKETLTSVVPVFKSSRLQIMEEKRRKAQEEAAEEERKRKEAELKKKEQIRAATLKRQPIKGGKRTLKKNTKYSTYKKRKHQRQNKSISKKRD
jgi:hypothetical protein